MSDYFIWVTDCYSNTGEGKLATLYLKKISKIKFNNYFVKSSNFESKNIKLFLSKVKSFNFKKSNFSKFYRYLIFIKGIFYLWINYLKGKKVIYVNYLPLWNFLIFMLSPPKTIFGPITGTSYFLNTKNISVNTLIRKYLFPKFFLLSNFFLKLRNQNYLFSTSLLKKKIFNDIKKKSLFDFQLLDLKITYNKEKKKLYDLGIYNRNHPNKVLSNYNLVLNNSELLKFRVLCVGEKILLNNVTNLGYTSNKAVINSLKQTRYALISEENLYSFFFLDVLKSGAIPIISKKILVDNKIFPLNTLKRINFNNQKIMKNSLKKILISKKKNKLRLNKKYLSYLYLKFEDYFFKNIK